MQTQSFVPNQPSTTHKLLSIDECSNFNNFIQCIQKFAPDQNQLTRKEKAKLRWDKIEKMRLDRLEILD